MAITLTLWNCINMPVILTILDPLTTGKDSNDQMKGG